MGTLIDVLKTCIPIIVGALIAIVPSITEKLISNKYEHKEKQQQEKQELYIEYSCAVTPQIRQAGNRLSGLAETAYASLLA